MIRCLPFCNIYNAQNIQYPILQQWLVQNVLPHLHNKAISININLNTQQEQQQVMNSMVLEILKNNVNGLVQINQHNHHTKVLTNNIRKIKLIQALSSIVVIAPNKNTNTNESNKQNNNDQNNKNKPNTKQKTLTQLQGLTKLQQYCGQYDVRFREVCRNILIHTYNQQQRVIKYSTHHQVHSIIQHTLNTLQSTINNGDIIIINKHNQNNNHNHNNIVQLLYPSTSLPQMNTLNVYIGNYHHDVVDYTVNNIKSILHALYIKHKVHQINTICKQYTILNTTMNVHMKVCREKNIHTINKYMKNNKLIRSHNRVNIIKGIIYSKLKTYITYKHYIYIQHNHKLQQYMHTLKQIHIYRELKYKRDIVRVQRAINNYVHNTQYHNELTQQYMHRQQHKHHKYAQQYTRIMQNVNSLLSRKGGYIGDGIQCSIWLINMSSWNNCQHFGPQHIRAFFKEALTDNNNTNTNKNHNHSNNVLKIIVNGGQLRLIMGDGSLKKLGFRQQNQNQIQKQQGNQKFIHEFQNQQHSCKFGINCHGYLYGKGSNRLGQLGIGESTTEVVDEYRKVKLNKKVKIVFSGSNRTVCTTFQNQIYQWGIINRQQQQQQQQYQYQMTTTPQLVEKPKFLSNKSIVNVTCTHKSIYVLTSEGQVYNVRKGLVKTFKGNVDDRILLTTGNNNLVITYLLNISVTCYDQHKKKSILGWFRKFNSQFAIKEEMLISNNYNSLLSTQNSETILI